MTIERARWALLAAVGVALVAAGLRGDEALEPARPERDEAKLKATLDGFWTGFVRQDAQAVRDEVDFPLAFLEQSDDGRAGERFVFAERDWPALARMFREPLPEDRAKYQIESLRLEWLGAETALAVYDLAAEVDGEAFGGRYLTILVWRDGWKVAVTSIPM